MTNLLENINVFCVSPAGVTEGSQLLTLVTCCRPSSSFSVLRQVKKRMRTCSLPSEFEDDIMSLSSFKKFDGNKNAYIQKTKTHPRQLIRRSLSDYGLRGRRSTENLEEICRKCIQRMLNKTDKKKKRGQKARKRKSASCNKIRVASCNSLISRHYQHKAGLQFPGTAFRVDGYQLTYLIAEMKRSHTFRMACVEHLSRQSGIRQDPHVGHHLLVMVAVMSSPKSEVLDSLGNKMVNSNILFRRSLEHALSWLSTLGGAFSALGDLSPAWAEEAAHVSLTQLRIALKLGDPGIQSRCRLYAAISLLQKGFLRSCRDIVRNEYHYAISLSEGADPRLRRMCLGIWAKLKYHWKLAAVNGTKGVFKSTSDGLKDIRNNAKYWNVYDLEENRKLASEPIVSNDSFL